MSYLTLLNGKLRVDGGTGPLVLSPMPGTDEPCCCEEKCKLCASITASISTGSVCSDGEGLCCAENEPGILRHRVIIPDGIALPFQLNISGGVNDDLLLDEQSITTDLGFDPFPYPSAVAPCIGAHTIGSAPGPFSDPVYGGITFPWNSRNFIVSVRDTIGFGTSVAVTLCINPDGVLCENAPQIIVEVL